MVNNMKNITFNSRLIGLLLIFTLSSVLYFIHSTCSPGKNLKGVLDETKTNIHNLNNRIDYLNRRTSRNFVNEFQMSVTLYLITPTYYRLTQQADLIRLSHTLKHVPNLYWIVVEDSDTRTELVSNVLKEAELKCTHLSIATSKHLVKGKNDPRWKKHRGVDQRNHGMSWIRKNVNKENQGVVYFADDDNTYHLKLFEEMRTTKAVSMWPVAIVGGLHWEGPVCKNGKVVKFFTAWKPTRKFPVDMAAFAINLNLLFRYPTTYINPDAERGFLETDFLEQFHVSIDDLEAKAHNCSKILVWHTQTAEPNIKQELRLQKIGKGSDPRIII